MPLRRVADHSIGDYTVSRGFAFAPLGNERLNGASGGCIDPVYQRFFTADGRRILVFDVHPDRLKAGVLPKAIGILGQPDFYSWEPGRVGANKMAGGGRCLVDADNQRLFFTDSGNARVLVWDIRPENFKNNMDAYAVIGQPHFDSRERGLGRNRLASPARLAFDPVRQHLYVSDVDNNRVMVFDVRPGNLTNGMDAMAVIGQADFHSRSPRSDLRKIDLQGRNPSTLGIDHKYQRLFVGNKQDHRVLVFDISELKEAQNPDAIAVIGQPDFYSTDPAVTRTRMTMVGGVTIDSENQLAYIPDGYAARNGVTIFDIHPERLKQAEMPALDQIGHINADGEPDFLARSANDQITPYAWTNARAIALDTVDHRLFLTDNYGHRVLIFQLDHLNRIQDRDAKWVLGQKDLWTSVILPGRDARTIKLPLAVTYDESHQRLFVADAWNDRVLVYDMRPGKVSSGMAASYVLGQPDFLTAVAATRPDRFDFGTTRGFGIGPTNGRAVGLTVDKTHQRLFVTDGGNNRVLVFDIHPLRIRNGAEAIAVLGQGDFTSKKAGLSASRWERPGDLVYDENHRRLFVEVPFQHRVLVFDVRPEKLVNGMEAFLVLGQPNFETAEPGLSASKLRQPDGLSYDTAKDRLYLTDKMNHRVMVYDARPEAMDRHQPEALYVIGDEAFDQVTMGRGVPRWHQNRLHDPRGNAFDPVQQRLFQTEGLNTRITVFTLPREQYPVEMAGRGNLSYESLDAQSGTDLMVGYATASFRQPAEVLGVSTQLTSEQVMEKVGDRGSRLLISEAVLALPEPTTRKQVYFDSRQGARVWLSLVNGDSPQEVRFKLQGEGGETVREVSRQLAGGEQLAVQADQLLGGVTEELVGSLWVESNQAIQVTALLQFPNGQGKLLSLVAPTATPPEEATARKRVVTKVTRGGGYEAAFVLLNPSDERMEGAIEFEGSTIPYSIAAGGVFYQEKGAATGFAQTNHAVVRSSSGAPVAAVLQLVKRRDGTLQTARTVGSNQEGTLLWAPIDTRATILRHGRADVELSIVNEGQVPASVYLELFDETGQISDRYHQMILLGRRIELSLEEVWGRSPLQGTLRVFSDTPVSMSLEKQVENVAGELILADIPLQETPGFGVSKLIFPIFADGSGTATELHLINTAREPVQGQLGILSPDGRPVQMILR